MVVVTVNLKAFVVFGSWRHTPLLFQHTVLKFSSNINIFCTFSLEMYVNIRIDQQNECCKVRTNCHKNIPVEMLGYKERLFVEMLGYKGRLFVEMLGYKWRLVVIIHTMVKYYSHMKMVFKKKKIYWLIYFFIDILAFDFWRWKWDKHSLIVDNANSINVQ